MSVVCWFNKISTVKRTFFLFTVFLTISNYAQHACYSFIYDIIRKDTIQVSDADTFKFSLPFQYTTRFKYMYDFPYIIAIPQKFANGNYMVSTIPISTNSMIDTIIYRITDQTWYNKLKDAFYYDCFNKKKLSNELIKKKTGKYVELVNQFKVYIDAKLPHEIIYPAFSFLSDELKNAGGQRKIESVFLTIQLVSYQTTTCLDESLKNKINQIFSRLNSSEKYQARCLETSIFDFKKLISIKN